MPRPPGESYVVEGLACHSREDTRLPQGVSVGHTAAGTLVPPTHVWDSQDGYGRIPVRMCDGVSFREGLDLSENRRFNYFLDELDVAT